MVIREASQTRYPEDRDVPSNATPVQRLDHHNFVLRVLRDERRSPRNGEPSLRKASEPVRK